MTDSIRVDERDDDFISVLGRVAWFIQQEDVGEGWGATGQSPVGGIL